MNILKFIESFSDERTLNLVGSRRESLNHFKKIGSDMALASIPFGLAGLALAPTKASASDIGPTPATPIGALQLALTLEYLENEFYQTALDTNNLIPTSGRDRNVFNQIALHEADHVQFLINGLGGTGSANFVPKPTFDFTAGGVFMNVFSDYQTFLAVAQVFEDTGVRAYKGQAANLISEPQLLTYALQIHSVEARHASEVRRIRGQKGWIPASDPSGGIGAAVNANYAGEEATLQAGFNTANVDNTANGPAIPSAAGAEAFDETLNTQQVVDIANLFIM